MNVDGAMGSMGSPNDPLFFLLHMATEKMFTEWQQNSKCIEANSYYGRNRDGQVAQPTDLLSPWGVAANIWFTPSVGAVFNNDCTSERCVRCGTRRIQ